MINLEMLLNMKYFITIYQYRGSSCSASSYSAEFSAVRFLKKMKSSYSAVGPLSNTVFTTFSMICKMPILDLEKNG